MEKYPGAPSQAHGHTAAVGWAHRLLAHGRPGHGPPAHGHTSHWHMGHWRMGTR